jgi:hypothetical protein
MDQGRLVGRLHQRDGGSGAGPDGVFRTKPGAPVIFDASRSSAAKLVGVIQPSTGAPATLDLEMTLEPGGQLATGYTWGARGHTPDVRRRVDGLGRRPAEPSGKEIVERTAGIWRTPFGRLTISTRYDIGGDPSSGSGELVDPSTGRVLTAGLGV